MMMCMRKIIFVISILFSGEAKSQVDVTFSKVTLIGYGMKSTTHHGILARTPISVVAGQYTPGEPAFPDYHASGPSMDCRHIEFSDNASISVSWESVVFYLGEVFSEGNEQYSGAFRFISGQPTKELDTDELPNLTDKQKRWINMRFLEANSTFGQNDIQFGFHLGLRELGYANFTSYDSEDHAYRVSAGTDVVGKLLLGPAIGFRKSISDLSILAYSSVSGSLNTESGYHLKYSPHLEATVFYGKKIGVFGSAYYRKFVGKEWMNNSIPFNANFNEFSLHFGLYFCTGD